jgi:integrase
MPKRMKKIKFPLLIKNRGATVKIYRVKHRDSFKFTVAYLGATGRERRNFADLERAKTEAASIARKLAGLDAEGLRLTGADRLHYVEAQRAIAATGLPLHSVAHDYARAFEILGGAHIVEAARYWKAHVATELPSISVAEAVQKFYEAKQHEGLSARYLGDIRSLLGDFARAFERCSLALVEPESLRAYLNRKPVGLVAKENRRRMLVVLFNFAKDQGWLRANEGTAADALGTYKIKPRDVEIYSPAELSRLLNAADDDFLPWLALIAFGGLRREELHKGLSWESINFDRGSILVPAKIAKTGRKRKITMNENLIAWLAPYRFQHGPIFAIDPKKRIAKVVKTSGVKWKPNALRHSFGSYRMEQTKNEGLVALEMGNSPKIVKDHYFEIVTEAAARDYWSLTPLRDDRKIVAVA